MKRTLDFSLFTNNTKFPEYSEVLSLRLKPMPETLGRANSAVMFAQQAEKQAEPWASAAFLRAALADLYSMGEVQQTDRPASSWVKIETGKNPLLHFFMLLRHLNIHVKTIAVESENSGITLNGCPLFLGNSVLMLSVLVITNLSTTDLAAVRESKKYDSSDLDECVAWFNHQQQSSGAGQLIAQGVAMFATLICDWHDL